MIDTSTLKLLRCEEPAMSASDARRIASTWADIAAQLLTAAERERRSRERGASRRAADLTAKAGRYEAICNELLAAARADEAIPYTEEPTTAGIQFVIPGCERQDKPKTAQLSLWP